MKKFTILTILGLLALGSCKKELGQPYPIGTKTVATGTELKDNKPPFTIKGIYYQDTKNYYYTVKDADSVQLRNVPDYWLRKDYRNN